MSSFFVNRPIVAIVISLVTLIAGAISVIFLPVSLFPEIVTRRPLSPPTTPGPMRLPLNDLWLCRSNNR
jgi:hypothetical protein